LIVGEKNYPVTGGLCPILGVIWGIVFSCFFAGDRKLDVSTQYRVGVSGLISGKIPTKYGLKNGTVPPV